MVPNHPGYGMDADNFLFNAFVLVEENPLATNCCQSRKQEPQQPFQRPTRGHAARGRSRWALLSTGSLD